MTGRPISLRDVLAAAPRVRRRRRRLPRWLVQLWGVLLGFFIAPAALIAAIVALGWGG